jgi:hypothetical protein
MMAPARERASLLPRPKTAPPAAMSAPRWDVLLLAAPGSQIFDGDRWWTIRRVGPCTVQAHPAPCSVFLLPDCDGGALLHWHLADEGWIRHPVVGGGS